MCNHYNKLAFQTKTKNLFLKTSENIRFRSQPAVALKLFGFICAKEKPPLEQLDSHHGEDEHEEHVDDQDVQHVLQRIDHTVKHSLQDTQRHL